MKNLGILNWREWPPKTKKGAALGGLTGALLTFAGYELNRWLVSVDQGGGDALGILVGLPSMVPLVPLAKIFITFGLHWPPKWSEDAFDGGHVWRIYLLAGLLNVILLAALGAAIGFILNLFEKRRAQKNQ